MAPMASARFAGLPISATKPVLPCSTRAKRAAHGMDEAGNAAGQRLHHAEREAFRQARQQEHVERVIDARGLALPAGKMHAPGDAEIAGDLAPLIGLPAIAGNDEANFSRTVAQSLREGMQHGLAQLVAGEPADIAEDHYAFVQAKAPARLGPQRGPGRIESG